MRKVVGENREEGSQAELTTEISLCDFCHLRSSDYYYWRLLFTVFFTRCARNFRREKQKYPKREPLRMNLAFM